jgi:hypothetical protein
VTARFGRRRHRSKTGRRLALTGDFPDTGETVTEILQRVQPPAYDGTTVIFEGASDTGLPDPAADYRKAIALANAEADPVQAWRQMSGKGWAMTVNTSGPGVPSNARLRAAHTFLRLKWAYLEQRGMGYRVDEADQVMQRGEELPPGSIIAETHQEAVTHLIGRGEPWEPAGGWNHGWAADLPWYDPDDQAAPR